MIEVKALVAHPMESGQRKDGAGNPIPRRIIHSMQVSYSGRDVFSARFEAAISANPYVAFFMRVEESGRLEFTWKDDNGAEYRADQPIVLA